MSALRTTPLRRPPIGSVLALLALSACADDPAAAPPAAAPLAAIDWSALQNPILAFDEVAIKDAFLARDEAGWHLGYSDISDDPFRFRLGFSHSEDLRTFQRAESIDQPDTGGLASPTVARAPDGRWVMTYNSHTRDIGTAEPKLYFRTSMDLTTWSEPQRIRVEGADLETDRLIDAAVAFAPAGAFLFFKLGQEAQIAHAASGSMEGPWKLLGSLSPAALENYQAIVIDGTPHLLATTLPVLHRPVLHRLAGPQNDPQAWRTWTVVRELEIPEQAWNTGKGLGYERANAGYLVDERARDGMFYLLYAGSTEVKSYEGRGHAKLGLARSRDLVIWEVPPAR